MIQLSLFTSYSYSLLVDCVRRDTRHVNSASKECQQTLVAADLLQPKIALICSAVSIMRSWWMPHNSAPSNTWSSAQRGSWTGLLVPHGALPSSASSDALPSSASDALPPGRYRVIGVTSALLVKLVLPEHLQMRQGLHEDHLRTQAFDRLDRPRSGSSKRATRALGFPTVASTHVPRGDAPARLRPRPKGREGDQHT